jgi:predicted nucleic acid-binding protein
VKVLVDTPVWSLAFRKKASNNANTIIVNNLINLMQDGRIAIIGSIRQEVLSGISDKNKFTEIRNKMSIFSDYVIQTPDYEFAAECSNECRRNGIQGSHTDFLICTVAIKNDWEIFTEDSDFLEYKKFIPIKLYTTVVQS